MTNATAETIIQAILELSDCVDTIARRIDFKTVALMDVAHRIGKVQAKLEKLKVSLQDPKTPEVLKLLAVADRHVCGLQGFGQSINDTCPACEAGQR